jgi:hypothetical protein
LKLSHSAVPGERKARKALQAAECAKALTFKECAESYIAAHAPVTRPESGNSLQGWEVDETIEERSGQVNFGCLYNAKGVSPGFAECCSPF